MEKAARWVRALPHRGVRARSTNFMEVFAGGVKVDVEGKAYMEKAGSRYWRRGCPVSTDPHRSAGLFFFFCVSTLPCYLPSRSSPADVIASSRLIFRYAEGSPRRRANYPRCCRPCDGRYCSDLRSSLSMVDAFAH